MIPEVSIVCTAYNHAGYLRDALEGFLGQVTSFPFEIIVHDDASTDGTTDIVLEYARRFPKLIVPIVQKENQHRYGKSALRDFAIPAARGEFVALCEGDDYWTDPHKLQKQYDILTGDKAISLCLHNALVVDYQNDFSYYTEPVDANREKTMEDIITEGGGVINPTASFFFRKEMLGAIADHAPVGDHFMMMELAAKGKVFWLAEPLSVYRRMSAGSWSQRDIRSSVDQKKLYHEMYVCALDEVNERSDGKYDEAIGRRKQYQRDACENETLPQLFKNREIGFCSLCRESPSSKTIVKAIVARFFPGQICQFVRRAHGVGNARKAGTLVSMSATMLPPGFEPLKSDGE